MISRSTDIGAALKSRQRGFLLNPFRFGGGGGGGGGGDPDFTSVSALLHFDGSSGSTTFTDSSSNAKTYTRTGTPTISTAQSQFGGASGSFPGGYAYIETPSDTIFKLGSGDFTVEAFVRQSTTTGLQGIAGAYETSSAMAREWVFYKNNANLGFQWSVTGTSLGGSVEYAAGMSANTWYHVAAVRNGSTFTIYVGGTSIGSTTLSVTIATTSIAFRVGAFASAFASSWNGYIDEFRLTKGVARYTANFTPPTAAFLDS